MMGFRDYLNDHPACREGTQAEFLDGTVYREKRGVDAFNALLRSVRKGDIVRVYRPFLLAPSHGRPRKQRRIWAERAEAIKAKGGHLISIDPPLKGAKLAMRAFEQLSGAAQGQAGKSKSGRPKKAFTDEDMGVIDRFWPPRRGWTVDHCLREINSRIRPRKVTRGWLYIRKPIET